MQTLRNARHIARFVLVWFALTLGAAIASPLVKPQALQLVCSGAGALKVVASDSDGSAVLPSPSLDCPICASCGSAPPASPPVFGLDPAHNHALPTERTIGLHAVVSAAPAPARGPPLRT